jgi:hypothetical protein
MNDSSVPEFGQFQKDNKSRRHFPSCRCRKIILNRRRSLPAQDVHAPEIQQEDIMKPLKSQTLAVVACVLVACSSSTASAQWVYPATMAAAPVVSYQPVVNYTTAVTYAPVVTYRPIVTTQPVVTYRPVVTQPVVAVQPYVAYSAPSVYNYGYAVGPAVVRERYHYGLFGNFNYDYRARGGGFGRYHYHFRGPGYWYGW